MTSTDPFAPANDFYAWTGDLTGYDNGHLLRSEPLADTELIPIASQGWRMLYVSTGHDGKKVAVSGRSSPGTWCMTSSCDSSR